MTVSLGKFAQGFASWRKLMAAMPDDEGRWKVFGNCCYEIARYVPKGLDRLTAVDQLQDIATAHGLADVDEVQRIIADAFVGIELLEEDEPPRATNGHDKTAKVKEPPPLLPLINIVLWQDVEPRPRQWVVRERIPARNVTLLTGQGGVGKTLLMQQLSVATVLAKDWIGEVPEFGPVLFITAEDDEDEMHFRYAQIAKHYKTSFTELAEAGLHLMSLAGKDATMAIADNRGMVKPTPLFDTVVRTARELRPRWIGLDTAADIFVVNERDRSQVRQCISLLRGLCLELDTTVILLSHPSLSGISSGSGLSGSTAWHNSVRSRMYLKTEKKKDGGDDASDDSGEEHADVSSARTLEFMKSNYSALALPVRLIWKDGLLVQEFKTATSGPERAALEKQAKDAFLTILTRFNTNELTASHKKDSRNFAPRVFSNAPEAKALAPTQNARRRLFDKALDQLLAEKAVHVDAGPKSLPPSKRALCLYRTAELPLEKHGRHTGRLI